MIAFGPGSEKAHEILPAVGLRYIEGVVPLAVDMLPLAERAYMLKEFSDVAYSTPRYLKEFQATKPKPLL